jgi:hypothetical protein
MVTIIEVPIDSQKEKIMSEIANDSELPKKRAKFTGSEKLIRDTLLEGIASKVLRKKAKGRLPHGYIASFVNGCENHCPRFKISHSIIKNTVEKKVKAEKAKAKAGKVKLKKANQVLNSSLDSPTVDETAAYLLVAMKKNITPVPDLSTSQVAKVHIDAPVDGSQNTAVVDPSPVPPS